ncbi:hypothetical protein T12_5280 [Trichinella patagoniensis]|uniref:Uncharacterized protein n=1 Tax=Trichinella patagoniensis TaxID=990121 RepID=A0A0V0Z079_9BILA|nr:hypothetical protein T12_5280 [Trichinella patagoniensis]
MISVEKSFLNTCSSLSKNPRGNKALLLVRKQRLRNASCTPSKGDCNTMEKSTSDKLSTAAVVSLN